MLKEHVMTSDGLSTCPRAFRFIDQLWNASPRTTVTPGGSIPF